jgi:hypothetical protein
MRPERLSPQLSVKVASGGGGSLLWGGACELKNIELEIGEMERGGGLG